MFNSWIKVDSFKMANGTICDLLMSHAAHRPMPELRLDYGCLSEWPIYDAPTGRVLYSHPERFPKRVQAAVEKLYKKLAELHLEGRA